MTAASTTVARLRDGLRRLDRALLADQLRAYERAVARDLTGGWQSLLDVGCGAVSAVEHVCASVPLTVGVDADAATVAARRRAGPYTRYEQVEALAVAEVFGPGSFDVVVAMDVIEHLDRADGFRLLEALETVARHRVLVCTPNGFLPQGEVDGNPLQVHRSGWSVDDFEARGYRVTGVHGWRPLRGPLSEPTVRPPALGHRLSAATQPLVTHRPRWAFQLLAVLDLPGPATTG